MAHRSCSSTCTSTTAKKILSTLIQDRFSSLSIITSMSSNRGYASSAGGAVNNMIAGSVAVGGGGEVKKMTKKASWVPDPKTGYYMPENQQHLDLDVVVPQIKINTNTNQLMNQQTTKL